MEAQVGSALLQKVAALLPQLRRALVDAVSARLRPLGGWYRDSERVLRAGQRRTPNLRRGWEDSSPRSSVRV